MNYTITVAPNSPEEAQALIAFLSGGAGPAPDRNPVSEPMPVEADVVPQAVEAEPELSAAEKQELIVQHVLVITQDAELKKEFNAKAKEFLARTGIKKLSQVPEDKLDEALEFLDSWRAE